ncbi:MAG: phosphatase PAP2 family protein [Ruminococcus sp.]|nr:phosphatase PAP2 family protein [Ruminococcus sp.]
MELIAEFDNFIFSVAEMISCSFFDWFFRIITYTGDKGIVWIVAGLALMTIKKTRKIGYCVIVSLLVTVILNNYMLKEIFDRTRPFVADPSIKLLIDIPHGSSFPSGHTSSSFAAATAIFMYNRKMGVFALAYATLMGLSRIYLHVHYATDVIGGMIVGIVIAVLVAIGIEKVYNKFQEKMNGEV